VVLCRLTLRRRRAVTATVVGLAVVGLVVVGLVVVGLVEEIIAAVVVEMIVIVVVVAARLAQRWCRLDLRSSLVCGLPPLASFHQAGVFQLLCRQRAAAKKGLNKHPLHSCSEYSKLGVECVCLWVFVVFLYVFRIIERKFLFSKLPHPVVGWFFSPLTPFSLGVPFSWTHSAPEYGSAH
jgi:hypothetical protein